MGDPLLQLSNTLVGRLKGGTAKTAVVSSAGVGMIMGSGAANVAVTGSFTIPLMKRSGYPAHIAGAIETVSSAGGVLLPPIMGSAAFILASFKIGRAHVCTPVTNAQLVCRLLPEQKKYTPYKAQTTCTQ